MMRSHHHRLVLCAALVGVLGLGCGEDSATEEAAETAEDVAEDVQDAAEDAADKAEDVLDGN